mmetsp:Transcript_35976/g.78797  ORF Transcript_35976/g.78797 Transcript_35976/m.78797 type:complete len:99 (+) Transcript_35976:134-430(+)
MITFLPTNCDSGASVLALLAPLFRPLRKKRADVVSSAPTVLVLVENAMAAAAVKTAETPRRRIRPLLDLLVGLIVLLPVGGQHAWWAGGILREDPKGE